MSDRPTPETDALIAADQHHLEDDNFFPATVYWRMCDHARRLERERDEARERADRMFADHAEITEEAMRERDEAREQLAKERAESRDWYRRRVEMLTKLQKRMRDPERQLVCDILANGQLLPDPKGKRYGFPTTGNEHLCKPNA